MAKQTFTTGQVLTAAQMTSLQQTAMLGGAASAKTASYTLVAADAGTAISMDSASATTITVNTALFAAGDTVQITNLGAGVCTITAGTATVNTSASLALAQYESGTLDFTSTSAAIFIKGAGAAASSGGITLISNTVASALSSLSFSSLGSYKQLLLEWQNVYHSNATTRFDLRFNSDSGANYYGNNTTVAEQTVTIRNAPADTAVTFYGAFGEGVNNNTGAKVFNSKGSLLIDNYTSSTLYKKYKVMQFHYNATAAQYEQTYYADRYWISTSAITSLDVVRTSGSGTFSNLTDSSIRLYGIS